METGLGAEKRETGLMLMLILEVNHFPMTKIRKSLKNYLPFHLKKCLERPTDKHEECMATFLLLLQSGSQRSFNN